MRKNGARGFLAGVRLLRRALEIMAKKGESTGWSAEACRASLEAAAREIDGELTQERYMAWREDRGELRPRGWVISRTIGGGSWDGALRAVGLGGRESRYQRDRWDRESVLEALEGVEGIEELSQGEYEELAADDLDLPSTPTVYRYVGSWGDVREIGWSGGSDALAED